MIDWLGQQSSDGTSSVLMEPPVSETALSPTVQTSLLASVQQPVGLVPANLTGLPPTIWQGSQTDALIELISETRVRNEPAMQTLLYTLLLSETIPPGTDPESEGFLLARIDRLLELGATDPAQALAEQGQYTKSPALFKRWFDATLLTGSEDKSCSVLNTAPFLAPDYAARIFCSVRNGDWQTAALTLEAAHALELLPPDMLNLLDRFLSPDVFEGAPPLPPPQNIDPLSFRLSEAIGERLPTASLPRAFATADLRDIAGWKAQLEAAERLTRIGALSPNRLLGLYTERSPSASGGVWDRVRAVQKFDAALQGADVEAVSKALPRVWAEMQSVHLEVPFATMFAKPLAELELTKPALRNLAWEIQLLSPWYKDAANSPPGNSPTQEFLAALANGTPVVGALSNDAANAIAEGFSPDSDDGTNNAHDKRTGEKILLSMQDFDSGMAGNSADITRALKAFRSFGLETTARSAGLQLMLLREH